MICGYNDWDALLDEAYMRGILEGRITPPGLTKPASLADYGRSIEFTFEELQREDV